MKTDVVISIIYFSVFGLIVLYYSKKDKLRSFIVVHLFWILRKVAGKDHSILYNCKIEGKVEIVDKYTMNDISIRGKLVSSSCESTGLNNGKLEWIDCDTDSKAIKDYPWNALTYSHNFRDLIDLAKMVEDNTKMPHRHTDPQERLYCLTERANEILERMRSSGYSGLD